NAKFVRSCHLLSRGRVVWHQPSGKLLPVLGEPVHHSAYCSIAARSVGSSRMSAWIMQSRAFVRHTSGERSGSRADLRSTKDDDSPSSLIQKRTAPTSVTRITPPTSINSSNASKL